MINLTICSLASGSSGNCFLVYSEQTAILIDVGISKKQICERLESKGLAIEDIDAVFITHEHTDHIRSVQLIGKCSNAEIFASEKTADAISETFDSEIRRFKVGEKMLIGDMEVQSFRISHDAAEPVGYSIRSGSKQITIATDTGCITEEIFVQIKDADIIVLESNHDENILRVGRYPWFLKQRIASSKGHLSNDDAAKALVRLFTENKEASDERQRTVLLAHLSKENNFPEMALQTVKNELESNGIIAGKKICIETLSRTEVSRLYSI